MFLSLLLYGPWLSSPVQDPPLFMEPVNAKTMLYYEAHCASCHGPQGAFYEPDWGDRTTEESLREMTLLMTIDPGRNPLEDGSPEFEALVAYHRAMIKRQPFGSLISQSDLTLRFEFAIDAEVEVLEPSGLSIQRVEEDEYYEHAIYEMTLAELGQRRSVVLSIRQGDRETRFALAQGAFTHQAPLSDPNQR